MSLHYLVKVSCRHHYFAVSTTSARVNLVTDDIASVPAEWHLIPSNGFSRMHECDRRHTDRRTDHAAVTCVAVGGITYKILEDYL